MRKHDMSAERQTGEHTLWYKDALMYEVHVRAFSDSNGDGIGDFPGLTHKLGYLQDLGVTAIWLLLGAALWHTFLLGSGSEPG